MVFSNILKVGPKVNKWEDVKKEILEMMDKEEVYGIQPAAYRYAKEYRGIAWCRGAENVGEVIQIRRGEPLFISSNDSAVRYSMVESEKPLEMSKETWECSGGIEGVVVV